MIDEGFNLFEADAEKVKDSPCNVCGRKSTARIRMYDSTGFSLFAVCDDHIDELKKLVGVMK